MFDRLMTREIKDREGNVVFRRWRLFKTPWFQIFIHAIYREDRDEHCHDHPWNFASLILKGGYEEIVQRPIAYDLASGRHIMDQDVHERRPGSFKRMQAEGVYHKISRLLHGTCWSLVFAGKGHRQWGYFHPVKGWMNHDQYRFFKRKQLLHVLEGGRK